MHTLKLILSPTTLIFAEGEVRMAPPVPIEFATFGHTVIGTATARGRQHLARLQWEVEAIVDYDRWLILQGIWQQSERLRRQGSDPSLVLEDTFYEFSEESPRSRALAAGASVRALGGGLIAYYARYYVGLADLKMEPINGAQMRVFFRAIETNLYAA